MEDKYESKQKGREKKEWRDGKCMIKVASNSWIYSFCTQSLGPQ